MAQHKILSDFDGVWTNQGREADEIRRWIIEESARVLDDDLEAVRAEVGGLRERMMTEPHAWGWAPDGRRISAYVDEDPLCSPSALCMYIEHSGDAVAGRYRDAIRAEFETLAKFGEHCFRSAMVTYRDRHAPAIVEDAAAQLQAVIDTGAEVVVVSNSDASKIVAWFRGAGIDAGEGDGFALRVRGSAGKQTLGETDESIEVGGRPIVVDRPLYRKAIDEENPDVIIGDVFSLDLALPHVMRKAGIASAPSRLVLRSHPHTPQWVLQTRAEGAIDDVVDSFGALASLLASSR